MIKDQNRSSSLPLQGIEIACYLKKQTKEMFSFVLSKMSLHLSVEDCTMKLPNNYTINEKAVYH